MGTRRGPVGQASCLPTPCLQARPWLFGTVLSLILALLLDAPSGGGEAASTEDFEGGRAAAWQLVGAAEITAEENNRFLATSGFSAGVVEFDAPGDFALTLRYRHAEGVGDILLCRKGPGGPQDLYHVLLREGEVALTCRARGRAQLAKSAPAKLASGAWHALRIARKGGRVEVELAGKPLVSLDDPRPQPVELLSLGSLAGAGFGFDDVALAGTTGAAAASVALTRGRIIYGLEDDESLRGWQRAAGARTERVGPQHRLRVSGAAEADWTRASAGDYTLAFRFLGDSALVSLQRSGRSPRQQEYKLRVGGGRVAFLRATNGIERELGAATVQLHPERWHADVLSSGGWKHIAIDFQRVIKLEDVQPLPPGSQVFCSMPTREVVYADVRLVPWTLEQSRLMHATLERVAAEPIPPEKPQPQLPAEVVPLQHAIFQYVAGGSHTYKRTPARIDPGNLPPNFVHTWILDVKGVNTFELHFPSPQSVRLHAADRISFYALSGLKQRPTKPLVSFRADAQAKEMLVDISKEPFDKLRIGQDYRRVYLQLETSEALVPRRFVLSGLRVHTGAGAREAILLGDDLSKVGGAIGELLDPQGKPMAISAPWNAMNPSAFLAPAPPPEEEGWHLASYNLTNATPLFYHLAYYNEQRGVLRLYLLNIAMPVNVTGATVTARVLGFGLPQGALKLLGGVVSAGSSAFSGIGGIVSSIFGFLDTVLGANAVQPLQLAISLDLKATVKGSVQINHKMGTAWRFFLPGRFPIAEAAEHNFLVEDHDVTAAVAPRYDRPMGLFGFRYHPKHIAAFPIIRGHKTLSPAIHASFPSKPSVQPNAPTPAEKDRCERLADWMPILYNSYAEIIPMRPLIVDSQKIPTPHVLASPNDWYVEWKHVWSTQTDRWVFDVSWKTHVQAEPGDAKFPGNITLHDWQAGPRLFVRVLPRSQARAYTEWGIYEVKSELAPDGFILQVLPEPRCVPTPYRPSQELKDVKVVDWARPAFTLWEDEQGNTTAPLDSAQAYPLDNVIFSWDVPYFYYARTRATGGVVPAARHTAHLRTPVMLSFATTGNLDAKPPQFQQQTLPSTLMKP